VEPASPHHWTPEVSTQWSKLQTAGLTDSPLSRVSSWTLTNQLSSQNVRQMASTKKPSVLRVHHCQLNYSVPIYPSLPGIISDWFQTIPGRSYCWCVNETTGLEIPETVAVNSMPNCDKQMKGMLKRYWGSAFFQFTSHIGLAIIQNPFQDAWEKKRNGFLLTSWTAWRKPCRWEIREGIHKYGW
jgi:hypothetical protein